MVVVGDVSWFVKYVAYLPWLFRTEYLRKIVAQMVKGLVMLSAAKHLRAPFAYSKQAIHQYCHAEHSEVSPCPVERSFASLRMTCCSALSACVCSAPRCEILRCAQDDIRGSSRMTSGGTLSPGQSAAGRPSPVMLRCSMRCAQHLPAPCDRPFVEYTLSPFASLRVNSVKGLRVTWFGNCG